MAAPVLTSNSPQEGSISWTSFTIRYEGVEYSIDAGSTSERWVWWRHNGGVNSIIETGPEIPSDITEDDLILFGNRRGIGVRVQSTSLIDGELLVDGSVVAKALAADAIDVEHLTAGTALIESLLQVKDIVAEAVQAAGLQIGNQTWNSDTGLTIPEVMNIPPNDQYAAYLWAKFIARELTIENYFKLQGEINELASGASLAIASGVTAPSTKPSLEDDWEKITQFVVPEGVTNLRGLHRESSDTWVTLRLVTSSPHTCELLRITNGEVVARRTITLNDGEGGFCWSSTHQRYFVASSGAWVPNLSGSNGEPSHTAVSVSSVPLDFSSVRSEGPVKNRPRSFPGSGGWKWNKGIQIYAYNSTYFMIAGWTPTSNQDSMVGTLWEWLDSARTTDLALDSDIYVTPAASPVMTPVGITYGKPPVDSASSNSSVWTIWRAGADPHMSSNPSSPPNPNFFTRAFGRTVLGAYNDGTNCYSLDNTGAVFKYQNAGVTGQVAYSFYDSDASGTGTHETEVSPPTTIAIKKGARVKVTAIPPPDTGDPDAPNQIRVYWRAGTSGVFYRQGVIIPPAQSFSFINPSSATGHGDTPGFDSAGITPARLFSSKSDALGSLIESKGDGSGRSGPFKWDDSGKPSVHAEFISSSAQNITNNSWTTRTGWTDVDSQNSPSRGLSLSNGVITVGKSGLYLIEAGATLDNIAQSAGRRITAISVNGTHRFRQEIAAGETAAANNTGACGGLTYLTAGSTISVEMWHNAGETRPTATSPGQNWFTVLCLYEY